MARRRAPRPSRPRNFPRSVGDAIDAMSSVHPDVRDALARAWSVSAKVVEWWTEERNRMAAVDKIAKAAKKLDFSLTSDQVQRALGNAMIDGGTEASELLGNHSVGKNVFYWMADRVRALPVLLLGRRETIDGSRGITCTLVPYVFEIARMARGLSSISERTWALSAIAQGVEKPPRDDETWHSAIERWRKRRTGRTMKGPRRPKKDPRPATKAIRGPKSPRLEAEVPPHMIPVSTIAESFTKHFGRGANDERKQGATGLLPAT